MHRQRAHELVVLALVCRQHRRNVLEAGLDGRVLKDLLGVLVHPDRLASQQRPGATRPSFCSVEA